MGPPEWGFLFSPLSLRLNRTGAMHDPGKGLRRTPLPRTRVNKGQSGGPELLHPGPRPSEPLPARRARSLRRLRTPSARSSENYPSTHSGA